MSRTLPRRIPLAELILPLVGLVLLIVERDELLQLIHPAPAHSAVFAVDTRRATDTITFAVVGDLMVGTNYPDSSYLPAPGDGNIMRHAFPFLASADVRLGNLEGAIADTIAVYKDCGDEKNCYAFRTPNRLARWYKEAGFNYLNLANNHSFDFGPRGAANTLAVLDTLGIKTSGCLQHTVDTLMVRDTRIGFVSFAPHRNCLDLNNDSLVTHYVDSMKQLCDILVVFFHGGAEGATKMHVPVGHELFYDQDRGDLRTFTHRCIDAGADIVLGSGPHVVRGMEVYKGKLIAYSLGNFATYHRFNLKPPCNVAPLLQLSVDSKGRLISSNIYSFLQVGEGIPVADTALTAGKLIKELSQQDFSYKGVQVATMR